VPPHADLSQHFLGRQGDGRCASVKTGIELGSLIDMIRNKNLKPDVGQGNRQTAAHQTAADNQDIGIWVGYIFSFLGQIPSFDIRKDIKRALVTFATICFEIV